MKKTIFLLSLSAFGFYSCGNDKAPSDKKDTADTTKKVAAVPEKPAKPVEVLDPTDSVFEWKSTIVLAHNAGRDPMGFAVLDNGNIVYVVDRKDSCIRIIDHNGKPIRAFGKKGKDDSSFKDFPDYVTSGPDGSVYVSDGTQPRILVFDSIGQFKYLVKLGGSDLVAGIAVNKQGTLFVSLATGWMLKSYDVSGKFIRDIKDIRNKGGVAWGYFANVALDSSGAIYVCDWRGVGNESDVVVHECDKDGAYLSTIPLLLDHGLAMFTADAAGRLFADAMDGVVAYNHAGRKIAKIGKNGKGDGEFAPESISGIQVDKAGYVYVLSNEKILIFR